MEAKKLAVIGYGGRGGIYGEYALKYPEQFKLVAIAEPNPSRAKKVEGTDVDVYSDYKELLDKGYELDLVAITTQDSQHKEHAIYALERGYDLLLEKPIAPNLEDCMEIYECAKKNNRKVFVCHVLRYAPFYMMVKDLLDAREIGDIVCCVRFDGVIFDVFPHGKIALFISYHPVNEGFLPNAVAKLLGDRAFELFHHPRNCRGELCSPAFVGIN